MKVGPPFSHFILLIFIFILFLILFAALVFHCPLLSVWLFNTLMVTFILSQHWVKAGERSRSWFHTEQVCGDLKHETWSCLTETTIKITANIKEKTEVSQDVNSSSFKTFLWSLSKQQLCNAIENNLMYETIIFRRKGWSLGGSQFQKCVQRLF